LGISRLAINAPHSLDVPMIETELYGPVLLGLALAVSVAETVAVRWRGRWCLWLSGLLLVLAIGALGYLDWQREEVKETSLWTYALVALVPTLAVTIALDRSRKRELPWPAEILVGFVIWIVLGYASLLSVFFV
jgi:hypothetical protein